MGKLTLETFIALSRGLGLCLSPDDSTLVLPVQRVTADGSKFLTSLWALSTDGTSQPERITYSEEGEANPAFLSDGSLAFTSSRHGSDVAAKGGAIWVLPPRGGEARPVLAAPGGVDAISSAAQVKVILARCLMYPTSADLSVDASKARSQQRADVEAVLFDDLETRYWDHELGPRLPRLFKVRLGDGSHSWVEDVAPDAGSSLVEAQFAISPDGETVVTTWRNPTGGGFYDIDLVAIGPGGLRVIGSGGQFALPAVSPDGNWVAALHIEPGTPKIAQRNSLCLIGLNSGDCRDLTADLDLWPKSATWMPDGRGILFVADDHGRAPIFHVDTDSGAINKVADGATYSSVCVARTGKTIYALANTYSAIPGVVRIAGGRTVRLPELNPDVELPGTLTELKRASDGASLRGYLVVPDKASPEDPAPIVLWIHGGPMTSWNAWHYWRWCPHLLVERGYAVLMPDPALSTGYGQDFMQRGWGHWGEVVLGDLTKMLETALERPDIDADGVAAMGQSFGGYMCNWIAGRTDRFKAIISLNGVWALDQFHGTTDNPTMWEHQFGNPYESDELYNENSPNRNVSNVKTPMLVVHGLRDYRVPISESQRLWTDLKRHGVPAKYLFFPDENHHIEKPNNVRIWYQTAIAFLDHHLRGEPWQAPSLLNVNPPMREL